MSRQRAEIAQDLAFEAREWRIQRLGWIIMATIIGAGLVGLLGRGPLSAARVADATGRITVEYSRFARYQASEVVRLHLKRLYPAAEGRMRVWINRRYLENMKIEAIDPQPAQVEASADRTVFVFSLAGETQSIGIMLHLRPHAFGFLSGQAGLVGGGQVDFRQLVYP